MGEARNFDARVAFNVGFRIASGTAQAEATTNFGLALPELSVTYDETTGGTRTLFNRLGYLTDPDPDGTPLEIGVGFVTANLGLLGLDATDVAEYETRNIVTNRVTGSTHIYLRQAFGGIPVYNGQLHINVNRDGRVLSVNNAFLPGLADAVSTTDPTVAAVTAVASAAAHLGTELRAAPGALVVATGSQQATTMEADDLSAESIVARLMWLPVRRGVARLVWNFQVHTPDRDHVYDMTVDAVSGEVWTRFDWVAGDSYKVYPRPVESPNHTTPAPPNDGRATVNDPADATGSPFGWHDTNGAPGAEFNITRGNNAHAYEDSNNTDTPPAMEVDCGGSRNCVFPVDLTQAPGSYVPAAVTNLFYWSNIIHDVQYRYGFDEAAGNFQVNNYGNGGTGGDDVRAEAQDGGGVNNANFFTPVDGQRPRMQMFTWTTATPNKDGDFDNGIIIHEYGHGISNRLVGGPSNVSCLNNTQQPGEGLSDWWSLTYTAAAGDLGATGRGVGTFALDQPTTGLGIRTQRYSTDASINTFDYASINGLAVPHGVGSVWAQAAWEMYWALVDQHGFSADLYNAAGNAGNQRAMLYVSEGLQNTVCSPTFADVRDGIIQAATDNHGGGDACRVWTAFANFGLGTDAVSGGPNSTTPTNGYALPPACLLSPPSLTVSNDTVTEGDAGTTNATFNVALSSPISGTVAVDYATADATAHTASQTLPTASNAGPITFASSSGPASPFPSTITVPPSFGGTTNVSVTLTGFSHTWPADIDVLLVAPTGEGVILMSDVGGSTDVTSINLTFDDAGTELSNCGGFAFGSNEKSASADAHTCPLSSGTYKPTGGSDAFPGPAPAGPYGNAFAAFKGGNAAGDWDLYVFDDFIGDTGSVSGGWSLTIQALTDASDYQPVSGVAVFPPGTTNQMIAVPVVGDGSPENHETFLLNLSGAVNATLVDAQGDGTITNDDTGGTFTDDPLVVGTTVVRAVHANELRARIDALRLLYALLPFTYTQPTITSTSTVVSATDMNDLRTALDQAFVAASQPVPAYANPMSAGESVRAVDWNEIRAFVVALEAL